MNYEALLKGLATFKRENSETAYIKVRDGIISKLITTPDGLTFVRIAFPEVDLNQLRLPLLYEESATRH